MLQKIYFKYNPRNRVKVKEWKQIHYTSTNQRKLDISIRQNRFQYKNITCNKEGKNQSISQETITILNAGTPKNRKLKVQEVKIARTAKINRKFHNYSRGFQNPSLNNLNK